MCKNSILIRNPKLSSPHYVQGVDPHYIFCDCGHCEDCKAKKRQGVYTRLYYEFQDAKAHHGYCINLTLTYRQSCLPSVDIDGVSYPCFRTKDVQKYIKRIRKYYQDRNKDIYFTYFTAMELGGKTHRPHYHILLFVKQPGTNMCEFVRVARSKWQYGFTSCGSEGAMVKDARSLNYCAKYVAKDAFEDTWYLPLIQKLKDLYKDNKDKFNYYKRCLSGRFLASRGLGLYALSANKASLLDKQLVRLPDSKGYHNVPLPQYLDRKRHYEVLFRNRQSGLMSKKRMNPDDVPTYVLNAHGMYLCQTRFKTKLEYLTNRLKEFINSSYTDDEIEYICRSFTNRSLNDVKLLFKGRNLERIAAFEILYLHRRDYASFYDDCVEVTSHDMVCDFMTLCNCSVHIDVGELGNFMTLKDLYDAPNSHNANIRSYRAHVSKMHQECIVFDANVFSFISWYLTRCNVHNYETKLTANKSYVYRKSLALMAVS